MRIAQGLELGLRMYGVEHQAKVARYAAQVWFGERIPEDAPVVRLLCALLETGA